MEQLTTIQSNLTEAEQKSAALKTASDVLKQGYEVIQDTQTTIVGNKNAQEAIQAAKDLATQIAEATKLAAIQLDSVAERLEAADKAASQQFQVTGGETSDNMART